MILDHISFSEVTNDLGQVTNPDLYKRWLDCLSQATHDILCDIGVDGDYDEWLDEHEEEIYDRLGATGIISQDPDYMEQEDVEETIHETFESIID